jgi:predicted nucleotidyltransferase
MLQERIEFPREHLARICRRYQVQRLSLFGSVLGSDFGPESDVDVLVEFQPGARLGLRYFELERELSELIGRKVDLNTAGFLSPDFRDQVVAEAEVQYDASA